MALTLGDRTLYRLSVGEAVSPIGFELPALDLDLLL
jgi:hypothetical protein